MTKGKLEGFTTARKNANRHTQRGLRALEQSIREDGYVAPITVAADGEALDGSARLETVADVLDGAEPIVIHHDGTRPIIAVRDDIPNADTEIAKRIAVRANRIASIDLEWDVPTLLGMPEDVIGELWEPAELEALGDAWAGEKTPDFQPVSEDEQGRLDQKKKVTCPECGCEFEPK